MSIFSSKNKNTKQSIAANDTQQIDPQQKEEIAEHTFQNRALLVLLIVGLASFVFSIWRIGHLIQVQPVNSLAETNSSEEISALLDNTNVNTATLLELQQKDTDQDGLSDYDELYTYKTSPYIADSDSDGTSDKAEIDQNTDPNCPKGTDCGRTTNSNTGNTNATANTNASTQASIDTSNMTADQLRELLRNAGASDTDLQQIDDDTLLETYRQTLPEVTANANAATNANNTNATSSDQAVTYEQLQNLTPAEIRQLLIQSGVDQATLNGVDDATIQQIFLDALDQQVNGSQ